MKHLYIEVTIKWPRPVVLVINSGHVKWKYKFISWHRETNSRKEFANLDTFNPHFLSNFGNKTSKSSNQIISQNGFGIEITRSSFIFWHCYSLDFGKHWRRLLLSEHFSTSSHLQVYRSSLTSIMRLDHQIHLNFWSHHLECCCFSFLVSREPMLLPVECCLCGPVSSYVQVKLRTDFTHLGLVRL